MSFRATTRTRQHGRTVIVRPDGETVQRRQPRPAPRRQGTRKAVILAATREA